MWWRIVPRGCREGLGVIEHHTAVDLLCGLSLLRCPSLGLGQIGIDGGDVTLGGRGGSFQGQNGVCQVV